MSEQIIDLRSTWAILRRRTGVLFLAASIGALGGGAAAYLRPPAYVSTSIVLLPPAPQNSTAGTHSIDTHVQIATSESVLGPAGAAVEPRLSPAEMADRVEVEAPTTDVLRITATGVSPAQAQALSDAVAEAEVEYLNDADQTLDQDALDALSARATTLKDSLEAVNSEIKKTQARLTGKDASSAASAADASALSDLTAEQANLLLQIDKIDKEAAASSQPAGQLGSGARVIQQASPAERTPLVLSLALLAGLGAAAALVLAASVIVLRGRRESALRSRDQIADAVGIPVVASIQSHAPQSVAGWTSLLRGYAPHNVETWTLRQLLRLVTPGHPGSLAEEPEDEGEPRSVVVLTLSGDRRALAVGPQVASFAASTGLRTQLVTAQQHESANALWAACAGLSPDEEPRPGLSVDIRRHVSRQADLVIHVAVMDRQRPDLHVAGAGHAVTLLAVTAGAATAEEMARVALAADDAGHSIVRIVVVDPDPLDRTTGRLLPSERAQQVPLPSLMTGSAIAREATALETRRRLR